ncbi:MAG: acyl-CoA thioesterase [Planctomycetes bacterium]|nr:acyl-CoA thioesterase [Planctomycetota bacterium]
MRYAETDKMGVVYHAHYFMYFETGRTEALRSLGMPYRALEEKGYLLTVVEVGAKFRAGAKYDDELRVVTRPSAAGRVRVRFDYEVWRGDQLLCDGFTVLACLKEGKVAEVPGEVKKLLEGP